MLQGVGEIVRVGVEEVLREVDELKKAQILRLRCFPVARWCVPPSYARLVNTTATATPLDLSLLWPGTYPVATVYGQYAKPESSGSGSRTHPWPLPVCYHKLALRSSSPPGSTFPCSFAKHYSYHM